MNLRVPMQAAAESVWDELQSFGDIHLWSPDATASKQIKGDGIDIGSIREVTFTTKKAETITVRERIVEHGDGWFRYVLDGGIGPYPEAGSHWMVEPGPNGCTVHVHSHVKGGSFWATALTPLVHRHLKQGLRRALAELDRQLTARSGP